MSQRSSNPWVEVEVVARRVNSVVRPADEVIIAPSNTITYDIVAVEPGFSISRTGVVPYPRVVSALGQQVDIEAAPVGRVGWYRETTPITFEMVEGIVWGTCGA